MVFLPGKHSISRNKMECQTDWLKKVKRKGLVLERLIALWEGLHLIEPGQQQSFLLPVQKSDELIISEEWSPLGAKVVILTYFCWLGRPCCFIPIKK